MRRIFVLVLTLLVPACGGAPAAPSGGIHASFAQCGPTVAERAPCVVEQLAAAARQARDVVALGCVTEKRHAMQPLLESLADHTSRSEADFAVRVELTRRLDVLEQQAEQCRGFDAAGGTTEVEVARQ